VDSADQSKIIALEKVEAAFHDKTGTPEGPVEVDASRRVIGVRTESAVEFCEAPTQIVEKGGRAGPSIGEEASFEVLHDPDPILPALRVCLGDDEVTVRRGNHIGRKALCGAGDVPHKVDFDVKDLIDFVRRADLYDVAMPVLGIEPKIQVTLACKLRECSVDSEVLAYSLERLSRREFRATLNLDHGLRNWTGDAPRDNRQIPSQERLREFRSAGGVAAS
jgi:hypothetical protein